MDGVSGRGFAGQGALRHVGLEPRNPRGARGRGTAGSRTGDAVVRFGRPPILRRAGVERAMEMDLEEEDSERHSARKGGLVADLTRDGQQFVLCKGGRGGLGNRNFATARRQTPRFAQPGEPGEEGEFLLELRTLAEVGLVGCPTPANPLC